MNSILAVAAALIAVSDAGHVPLPEPSMDNPATLMEALSQRATTRSFSAEPLTPELLSGVLWAAFGVNRPDSEKRTAPSAMNMQEIDIYAATAQGLFLYDPFTHSLSKLSNDDLREISGMQPFVGTAPLELIFVADYSRMGTGSRGMSEEAKLFYSACDAGFISQNVYLFCAVNGLGTVVRGAVDRETLARAMGLPSHMNIVLAQTVGFPEE